MSSASVHEPVFAVAAQQTLRRMDVALHAALSERGLEVVPIPVVADATLYNEELKKFCCLCDEEFVQQRIEEMAIMDVFGGEAVGPKGQLGMPASLGFILRDATSLENAAVIVVNKKEAHPALFFQKSNMQLPTEDADKYALIHVLCVEQSFEAELPRSKQQGSSGRGEGTLALVYALWYITSQFGWHRSFLIVGNPTKNARAVKFYDVMGYSRINGDAGRRMHVNHLALLEESLDSIRLRASKVTN